MKEIKCTICNMAEVIGTVLKYCGMMVYYTIRSKLVIHDICTSFEYWHKANECKNTLCAMNDACYVQDYAYKKRS